METADALAKLLSYGVLGPIVVVLWFAYKKAQDDLKASQEQRVKDAEKYAERTHTAVDTIRENTAALRALAATQRGDDDALDQTPVRGRRTF